MRGRWRWHLLVKVPERVGAEGFATARAELRRLAAEKTRTRTTVDVDAMSML